MSSVWDNPDSPPPSASSSPPPDSSPPPSSQPDLKPPVSPDSLNRVGLMDELHKLHKELKAKRKTVCIQRSREKLDAEHRQALQAEKQALQAKMYDMTQMKDMYREDFDASQEQIRDLKEQIRDLEHDKMELTSTVEILKLREKKYPHKQSMLKKKKHAIRFIRTMGTLSDDVSDDVIGMFEV